jgi:tetratricopeptide (TPR) repeat protein/DNA-binding XRE family transcriptional regulator
MRVSEGEVGVDAGSGHRLRHAQPSEFGRLLLKHRRAAGLTQEELANAAGVSVQAIGNLERGRARAAQQGSAEALCTALGLADERRAEFLKAARISRRAGSAPAGPVSAPFTALCTPPAMVSDFVGRTRELEQLRSWSRQASDNPSGLSVAVVGLPGVGKTTLAAAASHHLAEQFPDGCLAVDLRGMDEYPMPAGTALDRMLRSLGLHPTQIPPTLAEQSNVYRSMLAGRRMLVLLDNASDEAQVRPLLATRHGCLTLITCRQALTGLEALRWLRLSPLPEQDTVELVARILGDQRVRVEPQAVRELADLCGHLPLAVRIAGNRLAHHPRWSITSLTARLRDERTRLGTLTAGDLQVRPAFAVSYHRLSAPARHMFRRLALVPGVDFGVDLAAIAAGTGPSDARVQVDELVDASLVHATATMDRYQFHDLIRLFAGERLDAEDGAEVRQRAAAAVYAHLLHTTATAGRCFNPDVEHPGASGSPERAAAWLEDEASNWLAAARHAATAELHGELITLVLALRGYAETHQQHPWTDIFGLGVTATQALGDRNAEAALLNLLGWAQGYCQRNVEAGIAAHRRALTIAVEVDDRRERAWALGHLAAALVHLGKWDEALHSIELSIALFTELDDWSATNRARNTLGEVLRGMGRYDEALAAHRTVLTETARRTTALPAAVTRAVRAHTLGLIGEVLLDQQDWTQAAETFHHARTLINANELPGLAAEAALHEGVARRHAGQTVAAVDCLQVAITLFADVTTRSWRARALTELADTLEQAGAMDEAREPRRQARLLSTELDTDAAPGSETTGPSC